MSDWMDRHVEEMWEGLKAAAKAEVGGLDGEGRDHEKRGPTPEERMLLDASTAVKTYRDAKGRANGDGSEGMERVD